MTKLPTQHAISPPCHRHPQQPALCLDRQALVCALRPLKNKVNKNILIKIITHE